MKKILSFSLGAILTLLSLGISAGTASAQEVIPGCFPGQAYSTVNGDRCVAGSADTGCFPGYTFSIVTGARCLPTVAVNPVTPSFPNTGGVPAGYLAAALGVIGIALAGSLVSLKRLNAS